MLTTGCRKLAYISLYLLNEIQTSLHWQLKIPQSVPLTLNNHLLLFGESSSYDSGYSPCYRLDGNGQLFRFIYNNHVRDSIMSVSPERAVELYEAYVTIGKMMRDPANQIEYKMVPGDMVTFNNCRVMHGRSEFALTEQVSRFLSGMYMDWDIMYSRLRALSSKLNIPCPCY